MILIRSKASACAQELDHAFLKSHAESVYLFWDILDVELVHSFVDFTDQYIY